MSRKDAKKFVSDRSLFKAHFDANLEAFKKNSAKRAAPQEVTTHGSKQITDTKKGIPALCAEYPLSLLSLLTAGAHISGAKSLRMRPAIFMGSFSFSMTSGVTRRHFFSVS